MNIVLEYLLKVSANRSQELILKITHDKVLVQMKIFGSEQVHVVKLRPSPQRNIYVVQFKGDEFKNQTLTFKVEMDGRLFFFKVQGIPQTKSILLNSEVEIYELARRKEPRFKVPAIWDQGATTFSSTSKNLQLPSQVLELSYSGMRLLVRPDLPRFEVGQQIVVQFKIQRRAQISVTAIVKHVKKNKVGGPVIGIEFESSSALVRAKIQTLLDDITYYYAHHTRGM